MRKLYLLSANMLLLLALAILCPGSPNTYAEDTSVARAVGASSVSIALSPSIDLELLPTAAGTTSYKATDLTVSTNRSSGFRVLVNGNGNMLTNQHHSETIPSITANTILGNLPTNSFGIYLGATSPNSSSTFSPLSTTPTELVHNELANASGTYKLAIGAKVDTSLPAGLYSNELVISVVADPVKVFSGITYMQDMTSDICSNAEENDTMQLVDKRDGKSYWVAKLKDGNCWMVQNLALTFGNDANQVSKLTNEDSDINQAKITYTESGEKAVNNEGGSLAWNAQSTSVNPPRAVTSGALDLTVQNIDRSWNLGEWVLAIPLSGISCGNSSGMSDCVWYGFVDVSNKEKFTPGFKAELANWEGESPQNNTLVTVKCTEWSSNSPKTCLAGAYDEHYLTGNYYTYNNATAGTGIATATGNAANSICPKGWMLPTIGSESVTELPGSFQNLLSRYNILNNTQTGINNAVSAPLYLVRSGGIHLMGVSGRTFLYAGEQGYWRTASSENDYTIAPTLDIRGTDVKLSSHYRFNAFNVRCVAVFGE